MGKKLSIIVLSLTMFVMGALVNNYIRTVHADDEETFIYSVNDVTCDEYGNIIVHEADDHTVASDVPEFANLQQYVQNTSTLSTVSDKLSNLTATPENVVNGKTFIGSNGTVQTGTLKLWSYSNSSSIDTTTNYFPKTNTWQSGSPSAGGITVTFLGNGSFRINGRCTQGAHCCIIYDNSHWSSVKPANGRYCFSYDGTQHPGIEVRWEFSSGGAVFVGANEKIYRDATDMTLNNHCYIFVATGYTYNNVTITPKITRYNKTVINGANKTIAVSAA